MEDLASLLPLLLIAAVFYLLLIRPQRRRQLELMATQRSVTAGDEVLLAAGIVGVVRTAPEGGEFLEVEVAPGVPLRVARGAIARVMTPSPSDDPDDGPSGPGGPVDLGKPGPTVP